MSKYIWHMALVVLVFSWTRTTLGRSTSPNADGHQSFYTNSIAGDDKAKDMTNEASNSASMNSGSIWNDLSMVYRLYQQCMDDNLSVCLKIKLLVGLEKTLAAGKTLKLIDGVQFVENGNSKYSSDSRTNAIHSNEKDIEASLPRALEAKEQFLNNMIFQKISNFIQDHTLQVKFPDVRSDDASNTEEGRKKKKGGSGAYIMIPLLLGGTFVPIAYGALAMLAGKALIVSKLALVLASIIGIKKLLSGGGKESSHEVVVSSGGHSGWGRDFDLAYNAWKPHKSKHS